MVIEGHDSEVSGEGEVGFGETAKVRVLHFEQLSLLQEGLELVKQSDLEVADLEALQSEVEDTQMSLHVQSRNQVFVHTGNDDTLAVGVELHLDLPLHLMVPHMFVSVDEDESVLEEAKEFSLLEIQLDFRGGFGIEIEGEELEIPFNEGRSKGLKVQEEDFPAKVVHGDRVDGSRKGLGEVFLGVLHQFLDQTRLLVFTVGIFEDLLLGVFGGEVAKKEFLRFSRHVEPGENVAANHVEMGEFLELFVGLFLKVLQRDLHKTGIPNRQVERVSHKTDALNLLTFTLGPDSQLLLRKLVESIVS